MYRPDMGRGRGVATSESGEDADFSGSAGAGGAGAGAGFLGVCFGGWVRQTDTQIKETWQCFYSSDLAEQKNDGGGSRKVGTIFVIVLLNETM